MRPAHSTSMSPDTPPSRASPLPQVQWLNAKSANHPNQLWERVCPRRGRHIRHRCRLTLRHREQARSYRFSGCTQNLRTTQIMVGAGLPAKRPAHSTSMSPDTPPSRASPLPQVQWLNAKSANHPNQLWERVCPRRGRHIRHRCRLTLRHREQARSYRFSGCTQNLRTTQIMVGAGLPAMRPAHSTSMSPDTPPSRASRIAAPPLPQVQWLNAKSANHPNQLWERVCPRRGRHIRHRSRLTLRLREQARSYRFSV